MINKNTKKKIYKVMALTHAVERRAIFLASMLILVLSILYVYFVASAIVSTVVYKETRVHISQLNSQIATLETKYLDAKEGVTNDLATTLGLATLTNKTYIKRVVHVGRAQ